MPPSRKELTEADVPDKPPKLGKDATAEEKAAREAIMKQRRKLLEQLRDRGRDRSQRGRPPVEVATTHRELLRALKAPQVALAAVQAAVVPITWDQMQPLFRMTDQMEEKVASLEGAAGVHESVKLLAECTAQLVMRLFMWKLYTSWGGPYLYRRARIRTRRECGRVCACL
mgnify:FL=1